MATEPLAITFDDLYVRRGTLDMSFHPGLKALDGRTVVLSGVLAPTHDHHARHDPDLDHASHADREGGTMTAMLVIMDEAGQCPDCAPVPIATVHVSGLGTLPGSCVPGQTTLTVAGTLEFGYAVAPSGHASFVRISGANLLRESRSPRN
jgi:hypothetical protein